MSHAVLSPNRESRPATRRLSWQSWFALPVWVAVTCVAARIFFLAS